MQTPETTPQVVMPISDLYETDFYAWTQQQAELLRDRQYHQLDLPNLIEEIESLGKQQRQELLNRLSILLAHLLKWEYQPQRRSRSWLATIRIQRRDVARLLKNNPSLQPYIDEALVDGYQDGRDLAMDETDLPSATFPVQRPYEWSQVMDEQFFPGEPSDQEIDS